jgi:hypothetical protein
MPNFIKTYWKSILAGVLALATIVSSLTTTTKDEEVVKQVGEFFGIKVEVQYTSPTTPILTAEPVL